VFYFPCVSDGKTNGNYLHFFPVYIVLQNLTAF